jgi:ORF6N domain-containing protein
MAKAPKPSGKHLSAPPPVESLIHVIRGQKVMIDADLAALYEVPTKALTSGTAQY